MAIMKILLLILICLINGQEEFNFYHDNEFRQYYLFEPDNLNQNAPLVFVLHGYTSSATTIMNYSNMNSVAEQNGFAVCYPQGKIDQWNNRFWNVGYDFHSNQTVDDISFLTDLALHLQNENGYNQNNTFVTGMSNGGDMSYMLACQTENIFKAYAPVAGCMMQDIYNACNSSFASIFEIHGTNDDVTLWDGDYLNLGGWGPYLSTNDGINHWVEQNDCQNSEQLQGPSFNTIHHRYYDCNDNHEVWLYEINGGGHDWPNYSSEEIWSFFNNFLSSEDINGDGTINIQDVIMLINLILASQFDSYADLNDDGLIDILDIIILLNVILEN